MNKMPLIIIFLILMSINPIASLNSIPAHNQTILRNKVILFIGDFNRGWIDTLYHRIDLANRAGVEIVEIATRTSEIEDDTYDLDKLITYANSKGLGVILRFIVNSKKFDELIYVNRPARDEYPIPDYTISSQLNYAKDLVKSLIVHYDEFSNVVAYQIDWGFWGEDWIPWMIWPTNSANISFIRFLHRLSPEFKKFDVYNYANWPRAGSYQGSMVFYSEIFNESDPRSDPVNVAEFYWYQYWRRSITYNITCELRDATKEVTSKPILGFSYTHTSLNVPAYVYTANELLDGAISDANPARGKHGEQVSPYYFPIRDTAFDGMHFMELDFDTPYFNFEEYEEAVASLLTKGITPIIFYPQWSKGLDDSKVEEIVSCIKRYRDYAQAPAKAEVLIVTGHTDVGIIDYYNPGTPAHISSLMSIDPPGIIRTLEINGVSFDIVDADLYSPNLGDKYKAVIVHVPRDTVDGELFKKLIKTKTPIFIMHSSFMFSSPTFSHPTTTYNAYFENSNPLQLPNGKEVSVAIWGAPPSVDINFSGYLSNLPPLKGYEPNWLSSTYNGSFDEILASTNIEFRNVIARKGNLYFFGLDFSTRNKEYNLIIQRAFLNLLERHGVHVEEGMTTIAGKDIIVSRVWDDRFHFVETNGLFPLDYPFFNGSHLVVKREAITRLTNMPHPFILSAPKDAYSMPAKMYVDQKKTTILINTRGGKIEIYTSFEPTVILINGKVAQYQWARTNVIILKLPISQQSRMLEITLINKPKPFIKILNLKNNEYIHGIFIVKLNVSDDVYRGEYYIDHRLVDTTFNPPYSYIWNTKNYSDGPHILTIVVYDKYNISNDENLEIYLDNTPPEIINLTQYPAQPLENESIAIKLIVRDSGSGIRDATLHYRINGGSWIDIPMAVKEGVWSADIPGEKGDSIVEYYITIYDKVGNDLNSSIYKFIVKIPPEFKITSLTIEPSKVTAGRPVNITLSIVNKGEIRGTYRIVVKINGSIEMTKNISLAGGEEKTLLFKIAKDKPRTYYVEINGFTKEFKVEKPAETVLLYIIIIAILVAVTITSILFRKKAHL